MIFGERMKKDKTESTMEKESPEEIEVKVEGSTDESTESSAEGTEESSLEEATETEEKNEEKESESAKFQELNSKYLRLYAEFDNFRKRSAKESLAIIKTANADVIDKLIPILENFTLAFSPDQKASKLEDFEKGIKMIFNSFKDVLEDAGLEEISPEGEEFDPNLHEALMEQAHDTVEEGHIIQVYQKGYKVDSKILRHAKVITSKGTED